MNIDFKKFHKIETDDNCTVLVHPNGHQIKIAHKSLSAGMRKELDALPVKMAKGGKITYKQLMQEHGSEMSKPSEASNSSGAIVPEAAYMQPKQAKHAYSEPDQAGANPYEDVVIKALHREAPPFGPVSAEQPHYPPCINPSCKSYGRSHPNCRCYGGIQPKTADAGQEMMFAKGGQVGSYCSEDRSHKEGCEYFMPVQKYAEGTPDNPVVDNNAEIPSNDVEDPKPLPDNRAELEKEIQDYDAVANTPTPEEPAPQQPQQSQQSDINPNPELARQPASAAPEEHSVNKFMQHKDQVTQELYPESQAFQADLDNGHIQPQTYKDLFDKKDTLGKIGTLFGLLVGGASGAGPDTILKMMDNQINNDLKAQQDSVGNKQNFLKINQQALLAKSQSKNLDQETKMKAWALTKIQMNNAALHDMVQQANKLPPGPQKDQAMQTLAMMNQSVQNENFNIMDRAAAGAAFYKTLFGGTEAQADQNPESAFQKKTMGMRALGPQGDEMAKVQEARHIPGVNGMATRDIAPHDRDQVQAMKVLSDKAADLMSYAKQHHGTLSPAQRAVAQQKAEEMVNFYNNSIQGGVLTEGRLKWLDDQIKKNPTGVITQLMGNQQRLNEIKNSNDHRKDLLLKSYGFAGSPQAKQQTDTSETKMMNGAQYKKVAGGWQKVK